MFLPVSQVLGLKVHPTVFKLLSLISGLPEPSMGAQALWNCGSLEVEAGVQDQTQNKESMAI